jgi:hypothetical protein
MKPPLARDDLAGHPWPAWVADTDLDPLTRAALAEFLSPRVTAQGGTVWPTHELRGPDVE